MVCSKKQTNHVLQVSGESHLLLCGGTGKAACRNSSRLIPLAEWTQNVLPESFKSDQQVQLWVSA